MGTYITRGTTTVAFDHDPEHQRFAQTGPNGVTLYISGMGVLAERFGELLGPQRWTNYLMAGGRLVGIYVENADETTLTRYFHTDHLGSIAVITGEAGVVTQRLSYDAWGLRRHPDGTSTAPPIPPAPSRARAPAASPATSTWPRSASST